jgi:hypothetical protein
MGTYKHGLDRYGLPEMEYLGYIVYASRILVSAKKVEGVSDWQVLTTQEVRSFVQFFNLYRKFTHHFSDLTAPLADSLLKSQTHKGTMTHACLENFEILKIRLISAPCLILPEANTDVMFTVATNASTVETATILLQDHGGGLQHVFYWVCKMNPNERCNNTYYAYDLEALAV